MSNRYQYVGDLRPNVTNKWTINVMISRLWTAYNPTTNRILSLELIIVDERRSAIHAKIPFKLMNRFKDRVKEGCVYKIHNFTVLDYDTIIYRPLNHTFFVEFLYATTTNHSVIQPALFNRYVFSFVPFESLTDRYGMKTYLTDVIGVLREWGPLQDRVGKNQGSNPQLRKIIIADTRDVKLNVSLWGKMALIYDDNMINALKHMNIVVVLTCCKVAPYGGAPQLTTTVSTQFHLNLPIIEAFAYTNRPIHPVIFTSPYLKTEELKVTPIQEIYKRLTDGVDVGTRFIVYGMVTGIDLNHDWKYVQCNRCFKKAKLEGNRYNCEVCNRIVTNPRQTYKLVITIQDSNEEEMNCVLFNTDAILLLGHTTDELITKSLKEGAGNPDWIVDYFIDSLIAKWIVLGIKIDRFNLAPTFIRRYTVIKYYGDDVSALNKKSGSSSSSTTPMVYSDVNIPSSFNDFDMGDYVIEDKNMGSTITEDEENMMDDLMWGQVCDTKDSIHVEVQDVSENGVCVNTSESSSCSGTKDIEIDASDAQVYDAKVRNYQINESEVDEDVVTEPQVDERDVDEA